MKYTNIPVADGQDVLILTKTSMDELLRYLLETRDQQPENIKMITLAAIVSTNRGEWLRED
jgi:hypothetical protein